MTDAAHTTAPLADILARAARQRGEACASALRSELQTLGGSWAEIEVEAEGDAMVLRSVRGDVRLFPMQVTGWLLAPGTFSPERAAEKVAAALAPTITPIRL